MSTDNSAARVNWFYLSTASTTQLTRLPFLSFRWPSSSNEATQRKHRGSLETRRGSRTTTAIALSPPSIGGTRHGVEGGREEKRGFRPGSGKCQVGGRRSVNIALSPSNKLYRARCCYGWRPGGWAGTMNSRTDIVVLLPDIGHRETGARRRG